jgi:hypothetical protein
VTPTPFDPTEPLPGEHGDDATAEEALASWAADLAVDDAIRDRSRTQWLRRQAEEEGTLAGVLTDLGERGRPVLVHLHNGRLHRGIVTAVGSDYAVVRVGPGRDVIVALAAVGSVRTLPGEPAMTGDRVVRAARSLVEVLGDLAAERARVLMLGPDAAHGVAGELRAVGRDIATVRLDGGGGTAYVALASVAEISAPVSG